MSTKPKPLHVYKCEITSFMGEGMLSYSFDYAEITAESKAEAVRMASLEVDHFRTCKVEQRLDAKPGAVKGIKWLSPFKNAEEALR